MAKSLFSGNADDWEAYVEQLESYFVQNDITTTAKKRAILLSSCGTAAYKTIQSIVAPMKPTEVKYKDLVQKVQEHYIHQPHQQLSSTLNFTCPTSKWGSR